MTGVLKVFAAGQAASLVGQAAVLRTTPSRFALSDAGEADILLASCLEDPAGAFARLPDVRGVFLTDIGSADPSALARVAADLWPRPVVVASLAERALTQAQRQDRPDAGGDRPAILDGLAALPQTGAPGRRATALEGLALLEGLHGPVVDARLVASTDRHAVLDLDLDPCSDILAPGRLVCLNGPACLRWTTVSRSRRREVVVAPLAPAAPPSVVVSDGEGDHVLAGRYESGHRRDWIALHQAVDLGAALGLDDWIRRLRLIDRALAG